MLRQTNAAVPAIELTIRQEAQVACIDQCTNRHSQLGGATKLLVDKLSQHVSRELSTVANHINLIDDRPVAWRQLLLCIDDNYSCALA